MVMIVPVLSIRQEKMHNTNEWENRFDRWIRWSFSCTVFFHSRSAPNRSNGNPERV